MQRKLFFGFLLFTILLIAFTGCNRNRNEEVDDNAISGESGTNIGTGLASYEHTLTVFAPVGNSTHLRAAADVLEQNMQVNVEIVSYVTDEAEEFIERMLGMFAAGIGPDIFIVDWFQLYQFIENDFLADIYTLIDQSSDWVRDDFYTNALRAFEVGGQLVAFPTQFSFDMIGINVNVPAEFINRFAALEVATPSALMEIYSDLISAHPEFEDFHFINNYSAHNIFEPELSHAVDFANRTVNFAENTESFLENIRDIVHNNTSGEFYSSSSEEAMNEIQENYIFHVPFGRGIATDAFFDFVTPAFVNYIPVVDNSGNLVNNRSWGGITLSVSKNTDAAIAWAFIEQIISSTGAEEFIFSADAHISRLHSRDLIERGIRGALSQQFDPRPIAGSEESAVNNAANRIAAYSEMPLNCPITTFLIPGHLYLGAFNAFLEGEMSAADMLLQLEESILEWMNQERIVEPYIPAVVEDLGLPLRTLTIRGSDMHTGVFEQAAAAMNAAWRERDYPYAFNLIIQDHDWTDWENTAARIARLSTELMAGQGPDIFLNEDGLNLRAFARSGFLADMYTLMDNDPSTGREDFFTNALSAFEYDGGLYMFPVSFAFNHVGINAEIPQNQINNFSQSSTVTVPQLLEIYLNLRGTEFAHLIPGVSWSIGTLHGLIDVGIGDFVNFETRTAQLTDAGFISYLNMLINVFDELDFIASTWMTSAPTESYMRDRATEQIFEMGENSFTPVSAFFTRENPHFINYRLLADNQGRLLIDSSGRSSVWANFSITASGQPDLAWEFIQYLIPAYSKPVGQATVEPRWGAPSSWGSQSIATPILRSLAEEHLQTAFELVAGYPDIGFSGLDTLAERDAQIRAAINRILAYNEMPMALISPMIPIEVYAGPESVNLENFEAGAITAEAFAQQVHNSITLWLME